MKPAARIGDMQTCPIGGKNPHVGGPVIGSGVPTVIIGGLPAAVLGDRCSCVGSVSQTIKGSNTVFLGGKPALRLGDPTNHGGLIVSGCPNVLIG